MGQETTYHWMSNWLFTTVLAIKIVVWWYIRKQRLEVTPTTDPPAPSRQFVIPTTRLMDAKLVVVGGEARVTEVELDLPLTVGRGRSSGLALPHPLVSRKHCEIYEEEGKIVVHDLGSLNGTFVGDQRINEPTFLMPGELLTIGTVTFRAVYQIPGDEDFGDDESTTAELSRDEPVAAVKETAKTTDTESDDDVEFADELDAVEFADEDEVADADSLDVEFAEADASDSSDDMADAEEMDENAAEDVEFALAEEADEVEFAEEQVDEVADADVAEEIDAVEVVEEAEDVEEIDEVEALEEDEVAPSRSDVKLVAEDEAAIEDAVAVVADAEEAVEEAEAIDVDATVAAPQRMPQPKQRDAAEKKPASAAPGSKPASTAVSKVEEGASPTEDAAEHDTKEVEREAADTEAVEDDDDDLQAFLRGMG